MYLRMGGPAIRMEQQGRWSTQGKGKRIGDKVRERMVCMGDVNSQLLKMTLMLGKIEGRKRRGQQKMRRLDGIVNLMNMSLSKIQEIVKDRGARHTGVAMMGLQRVGHNGETEQQRGL